MDLPSGPPTGQASWADSAPRRCPTGTRPVYQPPRVIEDTAWSRRQIADLTALREGSRAAPWAVSDAPEAFVAAQVQALIGVEIPITRIEGKWKMSRNRPEPDRAGVIVGFRAAGEAELADLIAERGRP
nr:FMN-binding negative transcriptional regulator [Methylobacterium sp. 2A]